ncbi:IS605 OrfB family transposase [Salinibacter ruber]|uniref:RNA-guided endonuclease InsQ/TnpB family protein n=1 Tax=Salinibacter ruber TaxID=146919 RepID=UPI00216762D9|nr:transposase [Salinibacter ruber]MCS3672448.1 IS605 OrfB family transposase [Salinibacter ruber]MCS4086148.1 IS605 OrfB family transposase [Salinibacter ruber]MCS4142519.1 IS605 OrfB family transposase [Salinibacter ruber]
MTITVKCKLDLAEEQREAIDKTMEAFASACNDALDIGREVGTASNVKIHDRCYYNLREDHDLPANLAVRAIARAAGILKDSDRKDSTVRPSSIDYDGRTFSFKEHDWSISLSTVEGRQKPIALDIGDYQKDLLSGRDPSSAVVFRKRINGEVTYYVGIHIDVEEPPPDLGEEHGWVGVDLGVENLATLDDGTQFAGDDVNRIRDRYNRTRASLQSKGTKGAKRVLRRLSGRERRFQKSVNHRISKRIVEKARSEEKGIRLEDLSGIRDRIRGSYKLHSWAFAQLRNFVEYKAALAGVPVEIVDPAYTSRTCPVCGHEEKENRKKQTEFECQSCGHKENADVVGARNVARGAVCQPAQK